MKKLFGALAILAFVAFSSDALGQSKPLVIINGQTRQLPTASTLSVQPATSAAASINVPQGTTPTSPADGDLWTTVNGLSIRVNGQTTPPIKGAGATPSLAIGTSLYPTNVGGSGAAKYDPTSNVLTNTLGAKFGMFGAAAKDNVTWANSYVSGVDATGHAQLYSISTTGNLGGVFAARSSDNALPGQNVLGSINLVLADNTTQSDVVWGGYDAAYIEPTALSRGAFGREISIVNLGPTPALGDPYNYNVNGFSNALRLDCGDGARVSNGCSSAMTIVPNEGQALSGIVFADGALKMVGGYAPAIAMPSGYGIDWYTATGTPVWRIFSNAGGSVLSGLYLGDNALDIYMNNGSAHPFSVSPSGISAPGYKVGSTAGVSCAAGAVSLTTLVVTNGLVTHC